MKHRHLIGTLALVLIAGLLLGACQSQATPQIVEVTKEVPVEKVVQVTPTPLNYGDIVWISTQLGPVQEAEKMRGVILADFPGKVEFIPEQDGPFVDRITAEVQAGKGTVSLLGALHGSYSTMAPVGQLQDLTALRTALADRNIPEAYWKVAQLGTDKTYYVPWMQATYVLAANKKALPHLPQGADVNALTYEQLLEWAKNIKQATGEAKVGFPVGEKGLIHRFFQGFLVPSFSGGVVTTFASPEAAAGWQYLKDLWPYVHPQSTTYDFMQEPLLSEEVWVAWDHTARLRDALETKPDDFVVVPCPAGPKGRAFMPVMAGLAIPVTTPNQEGAEALIKYLTQPETQITTLREVGFFPMVQVDYPGYVSPGIQMEGKAVAAQAAAKDALPTMLPQGLGAKNGDFNKVFLDTFKRIVLKGEDVNKVLGEQKTALQALLDEVGAPCWAPDPDSGDKPCQVQ